MRVAHGFGVPLVRPGGHHRHMRLPPQLHLTVLPGEFAVCQLPAGSEPPAHQPGTAFWSMTVTPEEVSVVCLAEEVPADANVHRGLRAIKIEGPLDFDVVGVLGSLTAPLTRAQVSVFAVSTYNTDYVLVGEHNLRQAVTALKIAGHLFEPRPARQASGPEGAR
jgi:uncharacterized protein